MPKSKNTSFYAKNDIEMRVAQERLRQAHQSFNLALKMLVGCATFGLVGVGLFWFGKVPQGAIAATTSATMLLPCLKFAAQANDRLDRILQELRDDD